MMTEEQNETAPTASIECCICKEPIIEANSFNSSRCNQCSNTTCITCLEQMVTGVFSEPTLKYPFKCFLCSSQLDQTIFDEIISKKDYYPRYFACVLPLYWSKECLEENEKLASCPFCPYLEIHPTDTCPMHLFICRNPLCGKRSCLICLHEIDDETIDLHRSHCFELGQYKKVIEDAIDAGSQQHCPFCQLTGIKDDGCTHMTCQRCRRTWCYLCGQKEEECRVPDNTQPSLSAHNVDWDSNKERCPMSLISIQEIDPRWPESDRDCLEYFHRFRTLEELWKTFQLIGEEKFDEVNRHFGIIDASGYTIEQIKDQPNQIFIDYSSREV